MKISTITLLLTPFLLSATAFTQAPPAAAAAPPSTQHTCTILPAKPPTDAEKAIRAHDYATAESIYRAAAAPPADEATFADATFGLVHTLIAEGKGHAALDVANAALKLHPNNAVLLDAVGEAYFRRGETDHAAIAWNTAGALDPCNPRIHLDKARFFHLNAQYATEQRELDMAHRLAPHDRAIPRPVPIGSHIPTTAERIDRLNSRLESTDLSPDTRASLQRTLAVLQAESHGTCEAVNPTPNAQIPIVPIANGPQDMYGAGLEVTLNGKKRRLQLDTGASGLLIGRSVAQAAGLISEAESAGYGIGDKGLQKELLAHVDDIKIGPLEFHNCLVRISDQKQVVDVDGLIGPDVFSSYLVTLDVPSRVVRLAPLPKRPDDAEPTTNSLDTSGADTESTFAPRDRYVAPEMATWSKVFRSGHMLIFPTNINKGPTRLFLMDTGASYEGLISIDAAKEVTGVGSSDYTVKGVSGTVSNVQAADNIRISFAGVAQQLQNVPAVDLSGVGRGAGVEISGLIGFVTLRELIITIDYRDSLVHIVYDPKHGFHNH